MEGFPSSTACIVLLTSCINIVIILFLANKLACLITVRQPLNVNSGQLRTTILTLTVKLQAIRRLCIRLHADDYAELLIFNKSWLLTPQYF